MRKEARETMQKRVILDFLLKTKTHPTADEIFFNARERLPKISLATVYRNLKILKQEGKILELRLDKSMRFDANLKPHDHFVCNKCGKVFDLDQNVEISPKDSKMKYSRYAVAFYGICKDCKRGD